MGYIVALGCLAIVASLGSALFFMLRKPGEPSSEAQADAQRARRMARALALRVALSVALFVCLLLAWKLGYIQPHGVGGVRTP